MMLVDVFDAFTRSAPADTARMAAVRRAVDPILAGQWFMLIAHEAAHAESLGLWPPWPATQIDAALMALGPMARVREEIRAALVSPRLAALCGMPAVENRSGVVRVAAATRLNERLHGGRINTLPALLEEVFQEKGPHAQELRALEPLVARQVRGVARRVDVDAAARRIVNMVGGDFA